jgi:hypothetical protein
VNCSGGTLGQNKAHICYLALKSEDVRGRTMSGQRTLHSDSNCVKQRQPRNIHMKAESAAVDCNIG